MFCEKCGIKLPEESKFCPNCGISILNLSNEKLPDTEVQLSIHPSYKFKYLILPKTITLGVEFLIICLFFMIINIRIGILAFLICLIVLIIETIVKSIINKKQYSNYCYDFYKTKVIYKDSYLNVSEKEVKYKYIKEITMHQTFMQRYFNLGNIILITNAAGSYDNGIRIMNIENVEDVYKKIKSIINI